jgi:hypothetical protein
MLCFVLNPLKVNSQFIKKGDKKDNLITFGIDFNPIIPTQLLGNNSLNIFNQEQGLEYSLSPAFSTRYGMTIRYDMFHLINMFSIQTGIYYTQRNYNIDISSISTTGRETMADGSIRMIAYEIPFMGLLYVQLAQNIFMNVSTGFGFDFLPSHVYSRNDDYLVYNARKSWVIPSWKSNLGWEYRTEKSGFFYVGLTYHRPIINIADTFINYYMENSFTVERGLLSGIYFSLDLKYFFDPYKEKKEKSTRR